MRHATMVSADYPCIRSGRITAAMKLEGWTHDCFTRGYPPQLDYVYDSIDCNVYREDFHVKESDTELYHVHGEMHHFFPVHHLKESTDKPVLLNVHDLSSSRPNSMLDSWEASAIEAADALIFTTDSQREWARTRGYDIDKPTAILPNYVSSRFFISKSLFPHVGGICYEGSIAERGNDSNDRDFSAISDALDGQLHIYGGGGSCDYGIVYPTVFAYPLLIQRLATHDWGLAGWSEPSPSWKYTSVTKAYEYLAAGIPIISFNTPSLDEVVALGMGVTVKNLGELKQVAKLDPKPFRKAVMRHRHKFTTEAVIRPVADLYDELTRGNL